VTKRSNPAPVQRIQIDLTEKAKERLHKLREDTEAASYSEVIKRALILYARVQEEQEKGGQLGFCFIDENKELTFREVVFLT
jgi:metal-responsive CopG/Arc/MetJ family transcriptional regulator